MALDGPLDRGLRVARNVAAIPKRRVNGVEVQRIQAPPDPRGFSRRQRDGPGALDLHAHALGPIAELPVLEVISATHIIVDLTLGLGRVVYDYLREPAARSFQIGEMSGR